MKNSIITFDKLGRGLTRLFSPPTYWVMNTYLNLEPLSNKENFLMARIGVCFFALAVYFNFIP